MRRQQEALWVQGQELGRRGRWTQAAAAYEAIVKGDPSFLPAWLELARAQEFAGRYAPARAAVLRAAGEAGADVPPMVGLVIARLLRRYEAIAEMDAFVTATNLAARLPPEKLVDLAAFFSSAGCHQHARRWVDHVLRLQPRLFEAHNMSGLLHMFAGETDAAIEAFERALALRPDAAATHSALSRIPRPDAGHHHVDTLRRLLSRPGLSKVDEVHLGYALHNELHSLGDYEGAWEALQRACRARRESQPYRHAETIALFDAIREAFPASCEPSTEVEHPILPIFIVGMHRSGTTLLERILAGHSDVADAGETYTFSAQLRLAADRYSPGVIDLAIARKLSSLDYASIGHGFLAAMRWRANGKGWITEKMNPNFMLVGPILRALSGARVIHMRRDPLDTCFSNLRTLFTIEAAYSYDQVELADFYAAYHALMGHWRAVAGGRMYEVQYETLVAEPEQRTRELADWCGLSFQTSMLQVERKEGMVATASVADVRKGILKNRDDAWRPYEDKLGPLIDRLQSHGLL